MNINFIIIIQEKVEEKDRSGMKKAVKRSLNRKQTTEEKRIRELYDDILIHNICPT